MVELRPATAEMIAAMDGVPPTRTTRSFAFVDGERVLGIWGIYADAQRWVMFSSLTDEFRRNRRLIVRAIRQIMALVQTRRLPVMALADPAIPGSDVLVKHMGFCHLEGDLYVWHS